MRGRWPLKPTSETKTEDHVTPNSSAANKISENYFFKKNLQLSTTKKLNNLETVVNLVISIYNVP